MKKMNELLLFTAVVFGAQSVYAEGLNLVAQAEQQQQYAEQVQPAQQTQVAPQGQIVNKTYNYNDRPLNVDGEVEEEELAPDSELNYINSELGKQKRAHKLNKEKVKGYKKLKKTTEKLVDSTQEYVGERKESEAMIKDYNKQIKCLLEENSYDPDCRKEEEDKVQVQQAAPAPTPVEVAPEPAPAPIVIEKEVEVEKPSEFLDQVKVLPAITVVNYTGDNIGNIESNVGLDLRVESNVFSRLAIGLGFTYHTANFTDVPFFGGFMNQPFYGGYSNYYGVGFGNSFGGRGIEMESFGLDLYGKFFLFKSNRVRPYILGGIGFKRVSFEYENNNAFTFNAFNFGNESYQTNIVDGRVGAGAEMTFGNNIGFYGELSYGMGITDFGGSNTNFLLPDQLRLRDLSEQFIGSGVLTLTGGMTFAF